MRDAPMWADDQGGIHVFVYDCVQFFQKLGQHVPKACTVRNDQCSRKTVIGLDPFMNVALCNRKQNWG